jgi:hypothetical protein
MDQNLFVYKLINMLQLLKMIYMNIQEKVLVVYLIVFYIILVVMHLLNLIN